MIRAQALSKGRAASLLEADLRASRIAESYLFTGPQGSGKRKAAMEFAKALNCKGTVRACGTCSSCRKIEQNAHPDVFVLDLESQAALLDLKEDEATRQKELRIEAVRKLIARCYVTALEGGKKVMVVDGAERLSEESSNALLKILEECPAGALWILLTASAERILPTIRSRARTVAFAPSGGLQADRGSEGENPWEDAAEEFLREPGRRSPLEVSAQVMAQAKKGGQRKQAEMFLAAVTRGMEEELHRNPNPGAADRLARVLQSRDELRRNASPQLVLDSLLISLR